MKFKNSTIILELFGLPQNCFGRRICMISSSNALIYIYMIYLEYLQIIHPSASHPPLSIAVYVRVRIFVCTFEVNGKTLDTAGHLIHSRLSGLQIRKARQHSKNIMNPTPSKIILKNRAKSECF